MSVKLIEEGPYKGLYRSRGGIIYTEDEARARYPDEIKPAVKKSAKPKRKK